MRTCPNSRGLAIGERVSTCQRTLIQIYTLFFSIKIKWCQLAHTYQVDVCAKGPTPSGSESTFTIHPLRYFIRSIRLIPRFCGP